MDEYFNQTYYNDIWGTYADENGKQISGLHRHDYTNALADRIIAQFGKVKILDIATGCGHLVKTLREKGCDAWGTEISQYALDNTCVPGYVIRGDVRDLPFKDNSFDLVMSQGLWEYVPEEDVDKAFSECKRVGTHQWHNLDAEEQDHPPEHKMINVKPREWWNEKQIGIDFPLRPKILVASSTYYGKEYCFQEWIDNVKNLTYPEYDILVVDNSPDDSYVKKWGNQVSMMHIETDQTPKEWLNRICASMAEARKHFLKGNYTHWMNIEADNIPPKNVIETLLKYGKDADWISHCYPVRPGDKTLEQGIGCSLLSRKLIEDFNMDDTSIFNDSPDAELWNWVKPQLGKYKVVELWGIMDVKHLK